jgi:hypothetical protein
VYGFVERPSTYPTKSVNVPPDIHADNVHVVFLLPVCCETSSGNDFNFDTQSSVLLRQNSLLARKSSLFCEAGGIIKAAPVPFFDHSATKVA